MPCRKVGRFCIRTPRPGNRKPSVSVKCPKTRIAIPLARKPNPNRKWCCHGCEFRDPRPGFLTPNSLLLALMFRFPGRETKTETELNFRLQGHASRL